MTKQEELFEAINANNLEAAAQLIESGTDVNAIYVCDYNPYRYGYTPLLFAAALGCTEIAKLLLAKGAKTGNTTIHGSNALSLSSKRGYTEFVQLLIDHGVKIATEGGDDAILLAACSGHIATLELLIDNGANVHAKNSQGDTALILAAYNGQTKAVKLLIEKGANVHDATYAHKNTALKLAARWGNAETVKLLIDNGADIHTKNGSDDDLLTCAALQGNAETVKLLIENGADIHSTNHRATMMAINLGQIGLLRLLFQKGAKISPKAASHALFDVIRNGHIEIAKLLIEEKGANIHATDNHGNHPLMIACAFRKIEMINLLLANGANIHAKNNRGETASDLASTPEIKEMLYKTELRTLTMKTITKEQKELILNKFTSKYRAPGHFAFHMSRNIENIENCLSELTGGNKNLYPFILGAIKDGFYKKSVMHVLGEQSPEAFMEALKACNKEDCLDLLLDNNSDNHYTALHLHVMDKPSTETLLSKVIEFLGKDSIKLFQVKDVHNRTILSYKLSDSQKFEENINENIREFIDQIKNCFGPDVMDLLTIDTYESKKPLIKAIELLKPQLYTYIKQQILDDPKINNSGKKWIDLISPKGNEKENVTCWRIFG